MKKKKLCVLVAHTILNRLINVYNIIFWWLQINTAHTHILGTLEKEKKGSGNHHMDESINAFSSLVFRCFFSFIIFVSVSDAIWLDSTWNISRVLEGTEITWRSETHKLTSCTMKKAHALNEKNWMRARAHCYKHTLNVNAVFRLITFNFRLLNILCNRCRAVRSHSKKKHCAHRWK